MAGRVWKETARGTEARTAKQAGKHQKKTRQGAEAGMGEKGVVAQVKEGGRGHVPVL